MQHRGQTIARQVQGGSIQGSQNNYCDVGVHVDTVVEDTHNRNVGADHYTTSSGRFNLGVAKYCDVGGSMWIQLEDTPIVT